MQVLRKQKKKKKEEDLQFEKYGIHNQYIHFYVK